MNDPLAPLIADGIVEEVISRLKTGKEAELFIVQHAGEICAAKVYKERQARSFKNNAAYQEGRTSRSSRTQRAMDKGSRYGQRASEEAWKAKELEALTKVHAAGVRVPQPIMLYEGVLLMELVIDPAGLPAPRLIDAPITREQAAGYYADLRQQTIRILAQDLIHGDLSPYNVLLAWNGPTIIDFPQVVGAAHNSQAERFFRRDLENIHRFFATIDPGLEAHASDAREIWQAYVRRELSADFVPTGRFVEQRSEGHRGGRPPRHERQQGGERRGAGAPRVEHVGGRPHEARHHGGPSQASGASAGHGQRHGANPNARHHGSEGRAQHPAGRNAPSGGQPHEARQHGGQHHASGGQRNGSNRRHDEAAGGAHPNARHHGGEGRAQHSASGGQHHAPAGGQRNGSNRRHEEAASGGQSHSRHHGEPRNGSGHAQSRPHGGDGHAQPSAGRNVPSGGHPHEARQHGSPSRGGHSHPQGGSPRNERRDQRPGRGQRPGAAQPQVSYAPRTGGSNSGGASSSSADRAPSAQPHSGHPGAKR